MAVLSIDWQTTSANRGVEKEIGQHLETVLRHLPHVDRHDSYTKLWSTGLGVRRVFTPNFLHCVSRDRVELELSIVTDKEIKALKKRFFGIDEPTDVLSFPYEDQIEGLTGSIAISIETAAKQAAEAGIELIDELKMLATHGLLHILGYNHWWREEGGSSAVFSFQFTVYD